MNELQIKEDLMPKKIVLKTKENDANVESFIESIENEKKKIDCRKLLSLFKELTHEKPRMWGNSIIGFGHYTYKRSNGDEGEWFLSGFSPRKQNLTLYIMMGFNNDSLLKKLGKYKTGKSCLYVNRLDDINIDILKKIIVSSQKQRN